MVMEWEQARDYPPKVLAIYEAVGRLAAAGRDMEKLKVSDITREAGIGKGTAYEYFSSKEEIISRALCYQLHGMVSAMHGELLAADALREQLRLIIRWSEKGMSVNIIYAFFKLQMSRTEDAEDLKKRVDAIGQAKDRFIEEIADVLLETGIRQGLIREQPDRLYARMVMSMAMAALTESSVSRIKGGTFAGIDEEALLDYAMRMIRGALCRIQ